MMAVTLPSGWNPRFLRGLACQEMSVVIFTACLFAQGYQSWLTRESCHAEISSCARDPACDTYEIAHMVNAGKSTLLKLLAGRLKRESGVTSDGEILYNGCRSDTFVLERNAAYIDQTDQHLPTQNVHDLLKFAWKCQSGGHISPQRPANPDKSWLPSEMSKDQDTDHKVSRV